MKYTIYTDGGYYLRYDVGAFAYVILDEEGKVVAYSSSKIQNETSNRAELLAIIYAIAQLPIGVDAIIYTDSRYCTLVCNSTKQYTLNADLIELYHNVVNAQRANITIKKIKGHSGNKWNEKCDEMCTRNINEQLPFKR